MHLSHDKYINGAMATTKIISSFIQKNIYCCNCKWLNGWKNLKIDIQVPGSVTLVNKI